MTKYVSVKTAADLLGYTPRHVRNLIKSGTLKAHTLEGSRSPLVLYKDLQIVKDQPRPKPGRKRKGES